MLLGSSLFGNLETLQKRKCYCGSASRFILFIRVQIGKWVGATSVYCFFETEGTCNSSIYYVRF
uniref:Uncharacterized protein n=1 Tax=Arundo donax TaxID=35708 RepID=A0A0A9G5N7_ARUDO